MIVRQNPKNGHYILSLEWSDLMAEMSRHEEFAKNDSYGSVSISSEYNEWSGTKSFADAVGLAGTGWSEGLEKVRRISEQIGHIAGCRALSPEMIHDVCGAWVDVGVFVSGEPECMLDVVMQEKEGVGKVLRITVEGFYSSSVGSNQIINRGAAAMALIDALENAGYSCEVIHSCAMQKAFNGECRWEADLMLKRSGEALDADRLSFALIHQAMFRRIYFALCEHEPLEIRREFGFGDYLGNYGFPEESTLKDESQVYFETLCTDNQSKFSTVDSAAQWLREILDKYDLVEK
jgi:hypothetical protein